MVVDMGDPDYPFHLGYSRLPRMGPLTTHNRMTVLTPNPPGPGGGGWCAYPIHMGALTLREVGCLAFVHTAGWEGGRAGARARRDPMCPCSNHQFLGTPGVAWEAVTARLTQPSPVRTGTWFLVLGGPPWGSLGGQPVG